MAEIVLSTLNAKYIHAGVGLRYLLANLGDLREQACLLEFDINQKPLDIAEQILAQKPRLLGLGVYIWNATVTTQLVAILKRVRPDLIIILGGPEVSFETEQQEIVRLADYVITGEADLQFATLCHQLLAGTAPADKLIRAELPDLSQLNFPYAYYTDADIAHRVIYVEASRGCPFGCEFCLSSLDAGVRQFPSSAFLGEMQKLLDRGVNHFKFVDRTFNVSPKLGRLIFEFFLARLRPGLFLHFEMVPDRLPEELRELIVQFPAGTLQFEVGIQTFNPSVSENISRRQNFQALEDNLRFLRQQTNAHIHADLIAGLPGETVESFAHGFDRLVALQPQEIQVGILKRLRGAPISRHEDTWQMVFSSQPPWEILQNKLIDFPAMQRLRRFARYWDLVANSGNFVATAPLLWSQQSSPFAGFMEFSTWLYQQTKAQHGIALPRLAELLFCYLRDSVGLPPSQVAQTLWADWQRTGRCERPPFLADYIPDEQIKQARARHFGLRRQARWSGSRQDL